MLAAARGPRQSLATPGYPSGDPHLGARASPPALPGAVPFRGSNVRLSHGPTLAGGTPALPGEASFLRRELLSLWMVAHTPFGSDRPTMVGPVPPAQGAGHANGTTARALQRLGKPARLRPVRVGGDGAAAGDRWRQPRLDRADAQAHGRGGGCLSGDAARPRAGRRGRLAGGVFRPRRPLVPGALGGSGGRLRGAARRPG